jgi:hypothetical protein
LDSKEDNPPLRKSKQNHFILTIQVKQAFQGVESTLQALRSLTTEALSTFPWKKIELSVSKFASWSTVAYRIF